MSINPVVRGEVLHVDQASRSRAARPLAIVLTVVLAVAVVVLQLVPLPTGSLRTHVAKVPVVGQLSNRWQLFAPDPPDQVRDVSVQVTCTTQERLAGDWHNVSADVRGREKHRGPFQSRLSLVLAGEVDTVLGSRSASFADQVSAGSALVRTVLVAEPDACPKGSPILVRYRISTTDVSYAHRDAHPGPVVACESGGLQVFAARDSLDALLKKPQLSQDVPCKTVPAAQP